MQEHLEQAYAHLTLFIEGWSTTFLVCAGIALVVSMLSTFALVLSCARTGCRIGPSIIEWTKLLQYGWDLIGIPLSLCLRSYPVVGEGALRRAVGFPFNPEPHLRGVWPFLQFCIVLLTNAFAASCQIPFFHNLRDVYSFVFGWKRDGVFVEIGAFDGETISNTCCLADIGWEGHYIEPVPQYANQCRARHARNPRVKVHQYAVGKVEDQGKTIELQVAGPFSSGDEEEIAAMSKMGPLLQFLAFFGWTSTGQTAKATIKPLNAVLEQDARLAAVEAQEQPAGKTGSSSGKKGGARKRRGSRVEEQVEAPSGTSGAAQGNPASKLSTAVVQLPTAEDEEEEADDSEFVKAALRSAGFAATADEGEEGAETVKFAMDVMVLDVEGMEWQVLKDFDLPRHRPRLAIVEIQEKLTRMQGDRRQLRDAARIEEYFSKHGYSILYRDVINTVFIHRAVRCHGEN